MSTHKHTHSYIYAWKIHKQKPFIYDRHPFKVIKAFMTLYLAALYNNEVRVLLRVFLFACCQFSPKASFCYHKIGLRLRGLYSTVSKWSYNYELVISLKLFLCQMWTVNASVRRKWKNGNNTLDYILGHLSQHRRHNEGHYHLWLCGKNPVFQSHFYEFIPIALHLKMSHLKSIIKPCQLFSKQKLKGVHCI